MNALESSHRNKQLEDLQYKYAVACYALAYEILEMHWDRTIIEEFTHILEDVPLDLKEKSPPDLLMEKRLWKKPKKK